MKPIQWTTLYNTTDLRTKQDIFASVFEHVNGLNYYLFKKTKNKFYLSRAKIIWERLDGVQMNVCFEIAALFHSAIWWGKKGGNFQINIHLDSVDSFLCCFCSNSRGKIFTWMCTNFTGFRNSRVIHMVKIVHIQVLISNDFEWVQSCLVVGSNWRVVNVIHT